MIKVIVTHNISKKPETLLIDAGGVSLVSFSSNTSCSILTVKDGNGGTAYQACFSHGGVVDVSVEVMNEQIL